MFHLRMSLLDPGIQLNQGDFTRIPHYQNILKQTADQKHLCKDFWRDFPAVKP